MRRDGFAWLWYRDGMAKAWEITAEHIERWAERIDASAELPKLVRRLLSATAPDAMVEMRGDGGTRFGGWDGVVQAADDKAFCPRGVSVWEFSVDQKVKTKLDKDFEKRVKAPAPPVDDTKHVTYIAVVARRFASKQRWMQDKNARRAFREVRVYDADDLALWLERSPAVGRWFAPRIGMPAEDGIDVEAYLDAWSRRTIPPLPWDLVLSGPERESQAADVLGWLRNPANGPLRVQGATREEAILFVAAAMAKTPDAARWLSRAIVVDTAEGFSNWIVVQRDEPLIILPTFEGAEATRAAKGQAYVVLGLDKTVQVKQGEAFVLPELQWKALEKKLVAKGREREEAEKLVRESGGQLENMQQRCGYVELPDWAKGSPRPELFAFLLAGGWVSQNAADRKVIERLGGDPDALESLCLDLEKRGIVIAPKETWSPSALRWSAPRVAWDLLAPGITSAQLVRFRGVVVEVLGTNDPMYELPPEERFAAALHGRSLPHSRVLRECLSISMVLLGQNGHRAIVESLLWHLLSPESGWLSWASLSDDLSILAESAPEVFLDTLEASLDRGDAGVCHLFAEEGPAGSGRGSAPHKGLLWALETLAWSPDLVLLRRVALALARLAEADRDDATTNRKISNRPLRSLKNVLSHLIPQSTTTAEQRIAIITTLFKKHPAVALKIAFAQIDHASGGMMMLQTPRPRYLNWQLRPADEPTLVKDARTQVTAVLELVLTHAQNNATVWAETLEPIRHLPEDLENKALDALASHVSEMVDSDGLLWRALRERIALEYRRSTRRPLHLERFNDLYQRLTPTDLISQIRWLFEPRPTLPEVHALDYRKQHQRIQEEQVRVIDRLAQQPEPWKMLERLAQSAREHGWLGFAIGKSTMANDFEARFLASPLNECLARTLPGFIEARCETQAAGWLADVLRALFAQQRIEECVSAARGGPLNMQTWRILDEMGDPIREQYWAQLPSFPLGSRPPDELEYAIQRLLQSGHEGAAFKVASLDHEQVSPSTAVTVLEHVRAVKKQIPMEPHELEWLFEAIDRDEHIDEARVFGLELFCLDVLAETKRGPKYVAKWLGQSPDVFVDLIGKMYRRNGEPPALDGPTEEERNLGRAAHRILEAWNEAKGHPGQGLPPDEREQRIEAWAKEALDKTREDGRAEVGTIEVAKVLARAPHSADDVWPCIAARKLLESGQYPDLSECLKTAKWNLRGVWTRGLDEGGTQERDLSATYREYADKVEADYPRTAAMLLALARTYDKEAEEHDAEARRHRIEHGDDEQEPEPPPTPPRSSSEEAGGPLNQLEIKNIGLAPSLAFEFAPRLNLLTGDNSVGKTLILDVAWWALTGSWALELGREMVRPPHSKNKAAKGKKQAASISARAGERSMTAVYDARHERWSGARPIGHNLVVYARVDGSFSIWDPIRNAVPVDRDGVDWSKGYHFTSREILDGQFIPGTKTPLCEGLITDAVGWKTLRPAAFKMLKTALRVLSPPNEPISLADEPQRFSIHDARAYPKLKLPYGEVFPNHTSAGVARILGLCYALVWAISEIQEAAGVAGESPITQVTFLIDEVENHLHPKWQRKLMKPLLAVVKELGLAADVQLLITTHAPLVLASLEPLFDTTKDALFDLNLVGDHVEIRKDLWRIRGDVTSWLASDVFDRTPAINEEAEKLKEEAANAIKNQEIDAAKGREIYDKLVLALPEFDPFWVRWRFLAEQRGWLP